MNSDAPDTVVHIYALCEPDNPDAVRYIGQTRRSPEDRLYGHLHEPEYHDKWTWIQSLGARGHTPLLRVLAITTTEEALAVEQKYIGEYVARGARLLNVNHVPGRMAEVRRSDGPNRDKLMMLRLSPEEKAALQQAADDEHIPSLAVVARKAIIEWLERRGLHTDPHRSATDDDSPA